MRRDGKGRSSSLGKGGAWHVDRAAYLMTVEVSETTLRFDQRKKASLYARAQIADYWIINLIDRQLEVHRNPVPDHTQKYGYSYADLTFLSPADFVTPLAA